jgi:ActR/RegA family two-component response regulator
MNIRLSALRHIDRYHWREEIASAFFAERGHIARSAERLGVGARTLARWLAEDPPLRALRRIAREQQP